MHFIITDAWLAKSRAIHLTGAQLAAAFTAFALAVVMAAAALSQWIFHAGPRAGWGTGAGVVRLFGQDEGAERDRFVRENLEAMARRLGQMQAKLVQLESLGERVSGLAGMKLNEVRSPAGRGGALISARQPTLDELQQAIEELDRLTGQHTDLLTVIESRLIEQKMRTLMLPTRQPVARGQVGSPFGWRIDPFTSRSALHTGLDYEAQAGTAVLAAAGGIVVVREVQPAYGQLVEIDHGNDLVTRYAHLSRFAVRQGDVVRRGQKIAEVGSTGRSTGPHLHFEVLVRGVPQNPQKFLAAGERAGTAVGRAEIRRPGGSRRAATPG